MRVKIVVLTGLLGLGIMGNGFAQEKATSVEQKAPATTIDALLSRTGLLTVRESIKKKSIYALNEGEVTLEAVRIYTPGKEKAAVLGVRLGANKGGEYSRTRYKFIDQDELEGMIQAVGYMLENESKVSKSSSTEIRFSSKSGVFIDVFPRKDSIASGLNIYSETTFLDLEGLQILHKDLIDLNAALK